MQVTASKFEKAAFLRTLWVILGGMTAIYLFFWPEINSGFHFITGDNYDGVIEAVLVSHWHWVLQGQQLWNEPNYFFPARDVLGYNDGYFLYGLIAAIFRFLGANIFQAAQFTSTVVKLIGYFSMYALLKKIYPNTLVNIGIAMIFTIVINSSNQASHVQLFCVSFAPLVFLVLLHFQDYLVKHDNKKMIIVGLTGIFFFSAWLLTAYYMAFFFCLFACSVGFFYLFSFNLRQAYLTIKVNYRLFSFLIISFGIGLAPFLLVYIPKMKESGGHPISEVMYYGTYLIDVINIGSGSLLWGKLFQFFDNHFGIFRYGEVQVGFTPIFLFLYLLSGLQLIYSFLQKNLSSRFMLKIFIASLFWLIAVMRFGEWSLWEYLYPLIPGMSGVRVIARFYIFLAFPMALVVAHYFNTTLMDKKILSFLLLVLLIIEQINLIPHNNLNVLEQMNYLTTIQKPPLDCQSFYIVGSSKNLDDDGLINGFHEDGSILHYNVMAMLIADHLNLPTINGYSTFLPPDWNFAALPENTYEQRVATYAFKHNLTQLCRYDVSSNTWKRRL